MHQTKSTAQTPYWSTLGENLFTRNAQRASFVTAPHKNAFRTFSIPLTTQTAVSGVAQKSFAILIVMPVISPRLSTCICSKLLSFCWQINREHVPSRRWNGAKKTND